MRSIVLLIGAAWTVSGRACISEHVAASLPDIAGIEYGAVTAAPVYNYSIAAGDNNPGIDGRNFCNVSVNYHHANKSDDLNVYYYLPALNQYSDRFLATGGAGYSINAGFSTLEAGLVYNMVAGLTDGGMGSLSASLTDMLLDAEGVLNYDMLHNFGYLSIHEMTEIGKGLSVNFYNTSKVYAYYQSCSEGGREGWSQVQRYGDQYDGAIIGAPAFRHAFQQTQHLWPQIYETVNNYVPNTCELEKIINDTIAACDPMDGKTDGVVARSDLCRANYDALASVGSAYHCAASSTSSAQVGSSGSSSATPAQNGTVTAQGVAVFKAMTDGPYDTKGRHLYVGYQPGARDSSVAAGTYNSTSGSYYAAAGGLGAQFVNTFIYETDSSELALTGVTADTLRGWMLTAMQKYSDTLETVWTDLEDAQKAGGKIIHFHGEADASVPTMSSVIYRDQVRREMFSDLSYAEGEAALSEFYKLFLIPGAGHCSPNADNGPFPQTIIGSIIEWVEQDVEPKTLNATILQGSKAGTQQNICAFPYRPMWNGSATEQPECVWPEQKALDAWYPVLDSITLSVYGNA